MNAFEIRGLRKQYKDFQLGPLDLELPMGCTLGLVGENGAGKSTTIRLILDAVPHDAGRVSVLGADNKSPDFQRVKQDIGVVLDGNCFPVVLNANQVGKVMESAYRDWDAAAYSGWLKRFDLPEGKRIKDYSRGMTMKLSIAAALSHNAKLLLLDEATGGLDPMVRDGLLEVFADFAAREDHAVLLSSHIVSDLEKICDYIAFLHKGKLLFCEEKDVLLDRYGILKCGRRELEKIDPAILHGTRVSEYGAEALVEREKAPRGMLVEKATLEDIILHISKEEQK